MPNDALRKCWLGRWYNLKNRCENPSYPKWHRYGGRGITLDPAWSADSKAFLRFVVTLPEYERALYDENWTVDRIDNNQGYYPGNVRLATRADNNRNRYY
jgi:hypothetical protein